MLTFVGDQVTAGGSWQEWFTERETWTFAHPGDATDDLATRVHELVAANPEAISLQIGGNDFDKGKSVEHVVRNIEMLLMLLRRDLPASRLLLQSIMPGDYESADDIQDANRHLRQFAPSVKVQYLDLWPAMAGEDGAILAELSEDQRHSLTERGYEVWLSELRPAIDRLDDAPPMSGSISVIR